MESIKDIRDMLCEALLSRGYSADEIVPSIESGEQTLSDKFPKEIRDLAGRLLRAKYRPCPSEPEIIDIGHSHLAIEEASVRDKLAFLLSCETATSFTASEFLGGAEVAILGEKMIVLTLTDGTVCDIIVRKREPNESAHIVQKLWSLGAGKA